jgi:hypothetical protein
MMTTMKKRRRRTITKRTKTASQRLSENRTKTNRRALNGAELSNIADDPLPDNNERIVEVLIPQAFAAT